MIARGKTPYIEFVGPYIGVMAFRRVHFAITNSDTDRRRSGGGDRFPFGTRRYFGVTLAGCRCDEEQNPWLGFKDRFGVSQPAPAVLGFGLLLGASGSTLLDLDRPSSCSLPGAELNEATE